MARSCDGFLPKSGQRRQRASACRISFATTFVIKESSQNTDRAPRELGERGDQIRIAPRAMLRRREGTCLFVPERRRSRRVPRRDARGANAVSGAIKYACPRWDSNPYWSGFKPPASAIWATGASDSAAGAILAAAWLQRDGSTVGVDEPPVSRIRVSGGKLARSPVVIRSSTTTSAFGRKCTGCTAVINPVALSRK